MNASIWTKSFVKQSSIKPRMDIMHQRRSLQSQRFTIPSYFLKLCHFQQIHPTLVVWIPPLSTHSKLNFDGSLYSSSAAARVIIKDHPCQLIKCAYNLGSSPILALHKGVFLSIQEGISNLLLCFIRESFYPSKKASQPLGWRRQFISYQLHSRLMEPSLANC